ncbi:MAG: YdeI/OmpD-associated family protein [Chitinophagaceae bacterium]
MGTTKRMITKHTIQKMGAGYMHYIELDVKTVKRVTSDGNKRVLCKLNDIVSLHAAVMKTKEGMYYLMISAANLKKLSAKAGSIVKAEIEIDKSELQFHIPEEFAKVIATDAPAKKIFDSLTNGNKRGLIALVNMIKSSDKKIERALLIAARLKAGITSPAKILKKE